MAYGGSEAGFHFYQDFQRCERYWYWKYPRQLEPKDRAPALILGESGHEGLEEWYRAMKERQPLTVRRTRFRDAFRAALEERADQYLYRETYEDHLNTADQIVDNYCLKYPNENFIIIALEESLDYVFEDGTRTTGRVDLVVKDSQGVVKLMDHKFTGWSLANFTKTTTTSNQTAQYLNLWNRKHPDMKADYMMYNIVRHYKGDVTFNRPIVWKSQEDLDDYLLDLKDVANRLNAKLRDPEARWPKNTESCFLYNRPCPFLELCKGANYQTLLGTHFNVRGGMEE